MSSRNARSRRRPTARPTPAAARPKFRLEQLEAREVPAAFTWTGLGGDNRWSTPANWDVGVAPTGDDPNTPAVESIDDLTFPLAASQRTAQNDLPPDRAFNSITIGGSNYRLTGQPITLGLPGVVSSGRVTVNTGTNNLIALNMRLGSSAGSDQTFTVFSGADLTVAGRISGSTGSTLTKDGVGLLTLQNDNSGFTGPVKVNDFGGTLLITHRRALGDFAGPLDAGTGKDTTVGASATLSVRNVAGDIDERIGLGGLGVGNAGALRNLDGINVWTGTITLNANAALGADAGTLLVEGVINDSGSGFGLAKEGRAEVRLNRPGYLLATGDPAVNTYRGLTSVNNGVLTVGYAEALGVAGSPANGTVVNATANTAGQLRLADPTGFGFSVNNEALTLNGRGLVELDHPGALTNTLADNHWAGPVVLGSPAPNARDVTVGAAFGTDLIIDGQVTSPNVGPLTTVVLTKSDYGRVVLGNSNTFAGTTIVHQGTLTGRDSNAFGTAARDTLTTEVQVLRMVGGRTADDRPREFWLTYLGQTIPARTGPGFRFDRNDPAGTVTAAQLEAAVNALPALQSIGASVVVTRSVLPFDPEINPDGPGWLFSFSFRGIPAGTDLPPFQVTDNDLPALNPPDPEVTTVRNGTVRGEVQAVRVRVNDGVTGRFRVSFTHNGQTFTTPPLDPEDEVLTPPPPPDQVRFPQQTAAGRLEAALNAFPNIGGIGGWASVVRYGTPPANGLPGDRTFVITFGGSLVEQDLAPLAAVGLPAEDVAVTPYTVREGGILRGLSAQAFTVSGTTGTFSLTYRGQQTPQLPVNATAAQVQAALNALPGIGGVRGVNGAPNGSVTVTRSPALTGRLYTVTFGGALADLQPAAITALGIAGATAVADPVPVQDGPQTGNEIQFLQVNWSATRGQFQVRVPLTPDASLPGVEDEIPVITATPFLADDITAANLEVALNALPTVGGVGGRVTVTEAPIYLNPPIGTPNPPGTPSGKTFRIVFGGTLTGVNMPLIDLVTTPIIPPFQANAYTIQDGGRARTVVYDGGAVELGVEAGDLSIPRVDGQGRDTWNDSVTGDQDRTVVPELFTLRGQGVNHTNQQLPLRGPGPQRTGALRNVSGINDLRGSVVLGGPVTHTARDPGTGRADVVFPNNGLVTHAAIASAPDARPGHPTPDASYFENDYSLTVTGDISGGSRVQLHKRGAGHLILAQGNSYIGETFVEEGWITVQDDEALGTIDQSKGETAQPRTTVFTGAAVHVRPRTPGESISVEENVRLTGTGPAHPYEFINRRGAVINLGGANTWAGNVSLKGQVGLGVETAAAGFTASSLDLAGSTGPTTNVFTFSRTGLDDQEQAFLIETGTNQGAVTLTYSFGDTYPFDWANRITAYYPPRDPGPGTRLFDSGYVDGGAGTVTLNYGPGSPDQTQVEVIIDEDRLFGLDNLTEFPFLFPDTWTFTVTTPALLDGLTKWGSGRLALQGDGSYTGPTDIREGTVRVQNDTGLGRSTSGTARQDMVFTPTTTTAASGTVVEVAAGLARLNGGISAGIEVWSESLVLNAAGQQVAVAGFVAPPDTGTVTDTFALIYDPRTGGASQTTAPLPITATAQQLQDALNALPGVVADLGPNAVRVTKTGNVFTVVFGTAQSVAVNPLRVASGPGLRAEVRVSGGNASLVNVSGDNAWRSPVALNAGNRLDVAPNTRLNILGPVSDAANPAAGGSDVVKRGLGELLLGGTNTYRGQTRIAEGIVTAASGAAFGAASGGTVVADGAQLQLQGSLTIAGEELTVQGQGTAVAPTLPARWFNVGPAPTNNGVSALNRPTSGRITGVSIDPSDPDAIYVSTAGGGAWKTKDAGRTWLPLFDRLDHSPGQGSGANLVGGSVAVSPTNPRVVYFATGESNAAFDSYSGTGVYKSTDAGRTWELLLTDGDGENPLYGQAITKVLVDPLDPDVVYAASGTFGDTVANMPLGIAYTFAFDGVGVTGLNLPKMSARGLGGANTVVTTLDNGALPFDRNPPGPGGVDIPPKPEVQKVTVFGTAGTWTLSYRGEVVGTFPRDTPVGRSTRSAPVTPPGDPLVQRFTVDRSVEQEFVVGFSNNSTTRFTPRLSVEVSDADLQAAINAIPTILEIPGAQVVVTRTEVGDVITFDVAIAGIPAIDVVPLTIATELNATFDLFLSDREGGAVTITKDEDGPPTPGVWRHTSRPGTAGVWQNLTGQDSVSAVRTHPTGLPGTAPYDARTLGGGGFGPPGSVGPDDDYRITFPQVNATWSDLLFVQTNAPGAPPAWRLLIALGESDEQAFEGPLTSGLEPEAQAILNGVYFTDDASAPVPSWRVENVGLPEAVRDSRPAGFPKGGVDAGGGRNGFIKLAGDQATGVFATVLLPGGEDLREIQYSAGLGVGWAVRTGNLLTAFPDFLGVPPQGRYSLAIAARDGVAYVGGKDHLFRQVLALGTNWTKITPDTLTTAPAREFHALAIDALGQLVSGSDGGVWRYNPSAAPAQFADLNGTLGVTQLNSADPHPLDLTRAYAGAQDNGVQQFNNSPAWRQVDAGLQPVPVNGGAVRYDVKNPRIAYAVRNGVLRKTTDGGFSWQDTAAVPAAFNFPMVVDQVNTSRVVVGGANVYESLTGGASFANLLAPVQSDRTITAVATATYQGAFRPDPDFPQVTDRLSNTYDPDTIYATDGAEFYVSKNNGRRWVIRPTNRAEDGSALPAELTEGGVIQDIVVDPSNRDVVYLVVLRANDERGSRVIRSRDAGRTWADITADAGAADGLPSVPTWKLAVDPRTGVLYAGTDDGVYQLPNARAADPAVAGTVVWSQVGFGMPRVSVRDIVVNQTLNTLTAATYGRGMFQLLMTDYRSNSGALRALSGSSVWTGDVVLAGPTSVGANGTQEVQNGIAVASLNIVGSVRDAAGAAAPLVTKVGGGTLTLSGTNTYAGQTRVTEGVLQANNPKALGAAAANTVVSTGAALEIRADLEAEPVEVNGRGFLFNGRYAGALRNISNANLYTGPLTLGTGFVVPGDPDGRSGITIGADAGTTLVIGADPAGVLAGTGTVRDKAGLPVQDLDKELPGTLTLAADNTYAGRTRVFAGAVQVQSGRGLGGLAEGTVVFDGARVEVARNAATATPVTVDAEPLRLSGTGTNRGGALVGVRGDSGGGSHDNTWTGPITLDYLPNFAPPSVPGPEVALGNANPGDTLTIDAPITTSAAVAGPGEEVSFGLVKVGPGRVTLARANSYTGATLVENGQLRVGDNGALGLAVPSPEVQTVAVVGTVGTFRLEFGGERTAPIPYTATAADLKAALVALNGVAAADVTVLRAPTNTGAVFTVFFRGALAAADVPALVPVSGTDPVEPVTSVTVATPRPYGIATRVSSGATLEVGRAGGGLDVAEVLTINGDGVGGAGALRNVGDAGTGNTYSGPITLGASAALGADAGTTLTVSGVVQDPTPAAVPAARLRKVGAGTVVLNAAGGNPYAGRTVIDDGALRATDPLSLGSTQPERQTVLVTGANGTFVLTFDGAATPNIPVPVPVNPTQIEAVRLLIEQRLNALPTVGGVGGGVLVSAAPQAGGGVLYTVDFLGTLATANLPQMTATTTGAAGALVRTVREGPEGTTVNAGGTLQLANGVVVTTEAVSLRGPGFNNQGALAVYSPAGGTAAATFSAPLSLAGTAAIGTTNAGDRLALTVPISDNGGRYGVDVVGPGTVAYRADLDQRYTGLTNVRQGTLELSQTNGVAVVGPLAVGATAGTATVRATANDQIADTAAVTVTANGTFDLNGRSDAVGPLTVQDGTVRTGPAGQLTVAGLAMTGGLVQMATGGRLLLAGGASVTASAAGPAVVAGPGTFDLNGADRTVSVADNPGAAVDARISALVSATGTFKLTKTGAGRLAYAAPVATAVTTAVTAGDLQVDAGGFAGPVELTSAAASLSGLGTTGGVRGAGVGAAVGRVDPGVNTATPTTGTLTVGTTRFGRDTTFFVDLQDAARVDRLDVNGSATLGTPGNAATLSGAAAADFPFGVPVTILTASGGVAGRFAEPFGPGVVFLGGQKFTVQYNANSVVLTKTRAVLTSLTLGTSGSPSTLNQPVTFTAVLTPENGAAVPAGDTVTFTVTGPSGFALTQPVAVANNRATLALPDALLGLAALPGGTYTVTARYNADAGTFDPLVSGPVTQVVEVPVIGPLAGGPAVISPTNATSVGVQDAFSATATVTGERAAATVTAEVRTAGGALVRALTPAVTSLSANSFRADVVWDGTTDGTTPAADGAYVVTVAFSDPFGNGGTTNGVPVRVDNTSPVVSNLTGPTGQTSPGTSVRVLTADLADDTLAGWTARIRNQATGDVVRTVTGTGPRVEVNFDGFGEGGATIPDGRYIVDLAVTDNGGNSTAVTVPGSVLLLSVLPTVDPITLTPAPPVFVSPVTSPNRQDTVRVQTTVRDLAAPTVTYTVTVRDSTGTAVRTETFSNVPVAGRTVPILFTWDGRDDADAAVADGVYTVAVAFDAGDFGSGATAPASVTVDNTLPTVPVPPTSSARLIAPGVTGTQVPGQTTVNAGVADANFDRYEVRVTGAAGVVRTIPGTTGTTTVTELFDGRDDNGNVVADGTYTFSVAVFDRAGNEAVVPGGSVVVLTSPPTVTLTTNTPTVYGQAVTLTAAVAVPAGVADLLAGGAVQFFSDGRPLGGGVLGTADGTGTARVSITVPTFAAGTYSALTAVYAGSDNFLSGTSAAATHVVTPAPLTVRADDKTKVYGSATPPLTYQVSGLVNNDTPAVVTGSPLVAATDGTPVGTYAITRGSVTGGPNYTVTFADGLLTVTRAPLRIVADDATKVVGNPNPPLTARYEGLVAGDTASVVSQVVLSTPATADSKVGSYPIFVGGNPTAANYAITTAPGRLTVTPVATDVAMGAGRAGGARTFTADGRPRGTFDPFPGFAGGVRVASADFNRDGVPDLAAATGPGTRARVVILDGTNGLELFADTPFDGFTGGAFVAVGDVTGDGQADLVVTPDEGGGPRVVLYRGGDFSPVLSFFGIDDPDFRGGARASVGDLNGDGFAEVVVSAGFGGGPRVSIWGGRGLATGDLATVTADFLLFDPSLRNGTYTAVGDVNGDGLGDIIAGAGPGGGPRVLVLDGRRLMQGGPGAALAAPLANFFAGDTANRGGVRVAAKTLDGDLFADVVTGPGEGGGSGAVAYRGSSLKAGSADKLYDLPGFNDLSGVFVG